MILIVQEFIYPFQTSQGESCSPMSNVPLESLCWSPCSRLPERSNWIKSAAVLFPHPASLSQSAFLNYSLAKKFPSSDFPSQKCNLRHCVISFNPETNTEMFMKLNHIANDPKSVSFLLLWEKILRPKETYGRLYFGLGSRTVHLSGGTHGCRQKAWQLQQEAERELVAGWCCNSRSPAPGTDFLQHSLLSCIALQSVLLPGNQELNMWEYEDILKQTTTYLVVI